MEADPEYDQLLSEHREQRERSSFRRKDGEVVYSKRTSTEVRLRAAKMRCGPYAGADPLAAPCTWTAT